MLISFAIGSSLSFFDPLSFERLDQVLALFRGSHGPRLRFRIKVLRGHPVQRVFAEPDGDGQLSPAEFGKGGIMNDPLYPLGELNGFLFILIEKDDSKFAFSDTRGAVEFRKLGV